MIRLFSLPIFLALFIGPQLSWASAKKSFSVVVKIRKLTDPDFKMAWQSKSVQINTSPSDGCRLLLSGVPFTCQYRQISQGDMARSLDTLYVGTYEFTRMGLASGIDSYLTQRQDREFYAETLDQARYDSKPLQFDINGPPLQTYLISNKYGGDILISIRHH